VKNHERAAVIGLGTGHSASVLLRAGFARVDVIELAPGMIAAASAHFADINQGALSAPAINVYVEDGRNRLLRDVQARYDIISIEISSIWFVGATNLYSREFYELAKNRLAPEGVLQQWVQLHHSSPTDFFSVVRSVKSVFAYVGVWYVGGQGIILASDSPIVFRPEAEARLRATPALRTELTTLGAIDIRALAQRPFLPIERGADIERAADAAHAPINTDANRFLEYSSPRYNIGPGYSPEAIIAEVRSALGEPAWSAP
jgi:spermidine synthase